ncbi:unnamed protein product, partial [Closterium sp. NIES-54]
MVHSWWRQHAAPLVHPMCTFTCCLCAHVLHSLSILLCACSTSSFSFHSSPSTPLLAPITPCAGLFKRSSAPPIPPLPKQQQRLSPFNRATPPAISPDLSVGRALEPRSAHATPPRAASHAPDAHHRAAAALLGGTPETPQAPQVPQVPAGELRTFLVDIMGRNPKGVSKTAMERATGHEWAQLDKVVRQ